jgi:7-cyano-7-deazaguanine synthase
MKRVVMGLSGGMDSATLLGILLGQGLEVHCCVFYYGSKHGHYENIAASKVLDFYKSRGFPVRGYPIDLRIAFVAFNSNLLVTGGPIPEGHYNDENMKSTVVPGRNLIFSSVMAGLAESLEADAIALGVHSGDHHIYPDCRPDFIYSLEETVRFSSDGKVMVITPLLNMNKTSILKAGYSLNPTVPYSLTRTCYKDQRYACGKCGSCVERLEAFKNLGLDDPIIYEAE